MDVYVCVCVTVKVRGKKLLVVTKKMEETLGRGREKEFEINERKINRNGVCASKRKTERRNKREAEEGKLN